MNPRLRCFDEQESGAEQMFSIAGNLRSYSNARRSWRQPFLPCNGLHEADYALYRIWRGRVQIRDAEGVCLRMEDAKRSATGRVLWQVRTYAKNEGTNKGAIATPICSLKDLRLLGAKWNEPQLYDS